MSCFAWRPKPARCTGRSKRRCTSNLLPPSAATWSSPAGAIENDEHKATSHPGMVVAVRISDGKELWRAQVNDPESSPAIAEDGTVCIGSGFNGNAVVALRSESDEELKAKHLDRLLWRAPAPYPITDAITLAGDLVIVGGGNSDYVYADPHPAGVVMALDRQSGAVKWRSPLPDAVLGSIAARGRTTLLSGA